MNGNNMLVGGRITETRKRRGYSREKLAELSEISVQFLADIEKGRKSMTVNTLRRLAAALNVTTDYIVNGTEENSESLRLGSLLTSLTPYQREQAEKLLAVFVETISRGD
ncbi:MAG: helix-turn-helix domain-containing protein [Oscillospiraceae bacterium]|nr:helix-turn-helix domain-containing protein [Oscillospiraceae bacterium]